VTAATANCVSLDLDISVILPITLWLVFTAACQSDRLNSVLLQYYKTAILPNMKT